MVKERVSFYRIDPHRSKQAFEQLVQDWRGILVSDGYGLSQKWVKRQTCLAQLIRKADALAERKKHDRRRFGEIIAVWLRKLVSFAKNPATRSDGQRFTHILLLSETCRLKARAAFPALVVLIESYFQNFQPDLSWV